MSAPDWAFARSEGQQAKSAIEQTAIKQTAVMNPISLFRITPPPQRRRARRGIAEGKKDEETGGEGNKRN
jgi:hypothetical protein